MNPLKQKILAAMLMIVILCGISQAAEYFTTDGGVSVIPVFANTGAADTAMGTPVQGALIYSTSDNGIMYYDGSAWVSIESVADGTAANNTLRWDGSDWVESTTLTNDGTDIATTGDMDLQGGDITNTAGALTITPNTGNSLNINTSGTGDVVVNTDDLVVDASANRVGIGTAAPDYELDIAGSAGVDDYIYHNDDTDTYVEFNNDRVDIYSGAIRSISSDNSLPNPRILLNRDNANFDFEVRGSTENGLLYVDAGNDRVGIGTTSPSSILHIDSDAANTTAIATFENTTGNFQIFNTSANPETVITGSSGDLAIDSTAGAIYLKTDDADNTDWVSLTGIIADTDADTIIQAEESADEDIIRFDTAGSERMQIQSDGDVAINTNDLFVDESTSTIGIRTATPDTDYALDIASGYVYIQDELLDIADQSHGFAVGSDGLLGTTGLDGTAIVARSGINGSFAYVTNTGDGTLPMTTPTIIFEADADSGHFGIGETTQDSRLHVNSGATNTTAIVTVENTAGDFQIFNTNATPEAAITGNSGDLAIDSTGGNIYIKADDSDNTDWLSLLENNLADSDSDTVIKVEEAVDDDTIRFDIAGTERVVINNDGEIEAPRTFQAGSGTTTTGWTSVTFSEAFVSTPIVVVTSASGESWLRVPELNNITTTGFQVRLFNSSNTTLSGRTFNWIAMIPTQ